jgi:Tannase and feruloyl esterase
MWGQIAMKQLTGAAIAPAKLAQTAASAIKACDAADGVTDGIIEDPRTCTFNAKANICGGPNAPTQNCLTAAEADAIDKIWDGPCSKKTNKVWFGLDRGSDFGILDGPAPFALGVTQFHWDEHNRNFDWQSVSLDQYPQVAQDGSRNIADVTDTFAPLDRFKQHGGRLLTWVGGNDQFIYPRGVINYYRAMAARYARHGDDRPDFANLQDFYRLFRAPGVGHCGIGGNGPVPVDPFGALVNKLGRAQRSAANVARERRCVGAVDRAHPSALSLSAACNLQRRRQHGLCEQLLLRRRSRNDRGRLQ